MKKILVIEDEPRMRANLLTILRMEGFHVLEATNGREGVERIHQHRPDLIVCDIAMPELDGHGVLAEIRADRTVAAIPFLFLTARGDKADVRTGMNLGADDYLVKPFEIADLLAAIQARLKRLETVAPPRLSVHEAEPGQLVSLGLTPREAEILFWVARGKTNPEITTILDIQLTTVKKHLESIFLKLGVENRTTATTIALEHLGR